MPAKFNDNAVPPAIEDFFEYPKLRLAIDEMGDRRDKSGEISFSQGIGKTTITIIKATGSKYRDILEHNNVEIDFTGNKISKTVRDLLSTDILKARTLPPLSQDLLNSATTSMNRWGTSTENYVKQFYFFGVVSCSSARHWPRRQKSVAKGHTAVQCGLWIPYRYTQT